MLRKWIPAAALSLGAVIVPTPSAAHSFEIAVIAHYSGPRAHEGNNLWHGMRVATREADGHALETSDGHLGGVDSHLIRIDTAAGAAKVVQQLKRFIDAQGLAIAVIGPGEAALRGAWPAALKSVVVLANPAEAAQWPGAFAPPRIGGERGNRFETSYRHFYKHAPDAAAHGGYAAARLIDAAVRPLDGRLNDTEAVRRSFAAALRAGK